MDSKILVRSFAIQHDFCLEIQKVTWNALSAGVFSVEILLRSYAAVSVLLHIYNCSSKKQLLRSELHSWLCLWSNEETKDVSESAKNISRGLWTCFWNSKIINHRSVCSFFFFFLNEGFVSNCSKLWLLPLAVIRVWSKSGKFRKKINHFHSCRLKQVLK